MSALDDLEQLSQLLEGSLPPDEAAELQARLASDPALRSVWEQLCGLPTSFDALLHTPPPPELDDRILGRFAETAPPQEPARSHLLRVLPWLLAAAALLAWLLSPDPVEVVLTAGVQRLDGRLLALVGDTTIEIDGIVEIAIEPIGAPARVAPTGGDPMSRKRALVAAGVGAVVTVVVYEGSAAVQAHTGEPRVLTRGETTRIGQPPPPHAPLVEQGTDPTSELRARNQELELQNQLLQRMLEDLEIEHRGTPIPWSDDLPEPLRPEAFERNVREALEDCAPDMELVGFECSEPPCFALLRPPERSDWWNDLVNECPAWRDNYTSSVSSASGQASCPDGSTERYQVLGWSSHLIEPEEGLPPEIGDNRLKRWRFRVEQIRSDWPCAED